MSDRSALLPPEPSREVWNRLAERAGNIFSTFDWAECWQRHYGHGRLEVLTDDDHDPRVILPLHRSGRLVRQVRMLGNGPADQLGPVCAPEDRVLAAELFGTEVLQRRRPAWDVTLLQDVPISHGWQEHLGGVEVRRTPSPVVHLEEVDSWDGWLATMSKNFRDQARRRPRRLLRELPVSFRLATHETLEDDLAHLFRLHRLRWGDDAQYATGTERAFHEDFARTALDNGWLRLWMLDLDGDVIAALHGFGFAGAEYSYQSGRDPRHEHLSLGFVMYVHALRESIAAGRTEYRLLRGDEGYKSRFTDDAAPLHSLAFARTLRGRAAVAAAVRRRT